jgi:hypothetical protein
MSIAKMEGNLVCASSAGFVTIDDILEFNFNFKFLRNAQVGKRMPTAVEIQTRPKQRRFSRLILFPPSWRTPCKHSQENRSSVLWRLTHVLGQQMQYDASAWTCIQGSFNYPSRFCLWRSEVRGTRISDIHKLSWKKITDFADPRFSLCSILLTKSYTTSQTEVHPVLCLRQTPFALNYYFWNCAQGFNRGLWVRDIHHIYNKWEVSTGGWEGLS